MKCNGMITTCCKAQCHDSALHRLGVISTEDKPDIVNGMKDKFLAEFEKMQSERDEMEININNKACNTLKEAELQLAAGCPEYGLSKSTIIIPALLSYLFILILVGDVDTEVRQWHAHQLKREDVLRQIEMDTIDELSDYWKEHEKNRTQLIENHVSGLSVLFLSKGKRKPDAYNNCVQNETCTHDCRY